MVAERNPGAQRSRRASFGIARLDRLGCVPLVTTESTGPLVLPLIGDRGRLRLGPRTLVSSAPGDRRRNRTAGSPCYPTRHASGAAIWEQPDTALLTRDRALVLRLSVGRSLPVAHDPAPLAALVDHSHVL